MATHGKHAAPKPARGKKAEQTAAQIDLYSDSGKARSAKPKKKKKKKRSPWAVLLAVMASLLAVLLVAVGVLFLLFRYNYNDISDLTESDLGITQDETDVTPPEVINIALFGLDTRDPKSFKGNSDSIMVISIDQIHNKIKLVSILRDSLVPIDGYNCGKINSAYAHGGPELAIKTLNQNFGLNIRHYATVNFSGMEEIIDAVGGIEVDITEAERVDANKHLVLQAQVEGKKADKILKSGKQVLSGIQAVSYARIRYVANPNGSANDFGRTDRQRYVMEQLFNKALAMPVSKYPGFARSLLPYTETSLDIGTILKLAGILSKGVTFEQARVPDMSYLIDGNFMVRGGSTVYYNLDFAGAILHAFFYDDIPPEEYLATHEVNKSGWYK